MNNKNEKTCGVILILIGISFWSILPPLGVPLKIILPIHMSFVIPGVYLFEKPFIKYICYKIKYKKDI